MREQNCYEDIRTFFSLNKMHLVNSPPVTKATRAGTHLTPATFQFWISRFSGVKWEGCPCGAHTRLHIVYNYKKGMYTYTYIYMHKPTKDMKENYQS